VDSVDEDQRSNKRLVRNEKTKLVHLLRDGILLEQIEDRVEVASDNLPGVEGLDRIEEVRLQAPKHLIKVPIHR
jgi:hypothetical protein